MAKRYLQTMFKRLLPIVAAMLLALPAGAGPLVIFAAASLQGPLDEVVAGWAAETGGEAVVSYAGTSALARQIDAGAPADLFISATGNKNVITVEHMGRMKDKAIVANIGHFDNEIDMAGLKKVEGMKRVNIKPQYDEFVLPNGRSILILAEGRLMNLGCATGHPSFVMSASFTNQVLAQLELHANAEKYGKTVFVLPKHLDEKVARLHLDKLGVKLTTLNTEQADYLGVNLMGPFKSEHYRY